MSATAKRGTAMMPAAAVVAHMPAARSLAAVVLHVVSAASLSTAAVRHVCSVLSALMVFYVVSLVAALGAGGRPVEN